MWSIISLINRFFQQAFLTGSFYLVLQINFGLDVKLFLAGLLYFSILNEVYEYKVKTRNSVGDWYVGVKDMSVSFFVIIFILWFIRQYSGADVVGKSVVLLVFIGVLNVLNYVLEKMLNPSIPDHLNLEHLIDVVSNLIGPIVFTPFLLKVLF